MILSLQISPTHCPYHPLKPLLSYAYVNYSNIFPPRWPVSFGDVDRASYPCITGSFWTLFRCFIFFSFWSLQVASHVLYSFLHAIQYIYVTHNSSSLCVTGTSEDTAGPECTLSYEIFGKLSPLSSMHIMHQGKGFCCDDGSSKVQDKKTRTLNNLLDPSLILE
jgi:hypothetical protein